MLYLVGTAAVESVEGRVDDFIAAAGWDVALGEVVVALAAIYAAEDLLACGFNRYFSIQ
jgi:hypothetical protein